MKLRYTGPARQSIRNVLSYIKAESPQGAARVRARIMEAAALIENHPQAGQETDRPSIRRVVLNPHPYALLYRVTEREVVVIEVRHTARKP